MCVCPCSERVLELSDTVKHLRSQGAAKDASLDTMHISLDRMVRPAGSPLRLSGRIVKGRVGVGTRVSCWGPPHASLD